MLGLISQLLVNILAVFIIVAFIPANNLAYLALTGLVLGLLNYLIRPVSKIISTILIIAIIAAIIAYLWLQP